MGKTKIIELTDEQRTALENGYRTGKSHALRSRCQMVLLKSEKRTAAEITEILGGCEVVVNNWVKRFEAIGIKGLETRPAVNFDNATKLLTFAEPINYIGAVTYGDAVIGGQASDLRTANSFIPEFEVALQKENKRLSVENFSYANVIQKT